MEQNQFLANFVSVLEDTDPNQITLETKFRELNEWDSLTALSLIAMVDEEYQIKLSGEDIISSETINDLFNKVSAKSWIHSLF